MSAFLVVRYPAGALRAVLVYPEEDHGQAEGDREFWERAGYETIIVLGFELDDVMRTHPSWFRVASAGGPS